MALSAWPVPPEKASARELLRCGHGLIGRVLFIDIFSTITVKPPPIKIARKKPMARKNHELLTDSTAPAERDGAFLQAFQTALRDCALPIFEETARHAIASGIDAVVEFAVENQQEPRICLNAKHPDDERYSSYSIIADVAAQAVIHREFYADTALTRRQAGLVPSINQKVIDTYLATLFNKAFALSLPHLLKRHPAGFW
jgi:hypothetical protein